MAKHANIIGQGAKLTGIIDELESQGVTVGGNQSVSDIIAAIDAAGVGGIPAGTTTKYATGSHAGSVTTLTLNLGWRPRYIIVRGSRGFWIFSRYAGVSTYTTTNSLGTSSTNYTTYGLYYHAATSNRSYPTGSTQYINSTGISNAPLSSINSSYTYTWEAFGDLQY